MANKRMFCKNIVESSAFVTMSNEAKVLYFYVNMEADDDGFCDNVEVQMRIVQANEQHLQELLDKRFLIKANGAYLVKHWLLHNTIRKDTYKPSTYARKNKNIVTDENNSYVISNVSVDVPLTQDRLDKNRLDKNRKDNNNKKEEKIIKKENSIMFDVLLDMAIAQGGMVSKEDCERYNVDYYELFAAYQKELNEND